MYVQYNRYIVYIRHFSVKKGLDDCKNFNCRTVDRHYHLTYGTTASDVLTNVTSLKIGNGAEGDRPRNSKFISERRAE